MAAAGLDYVLVDAFTDRPLQGNPVAVFTAAQGLSATLMQRIARELNLSETCFLFPPEGAGQHRVRIFTPVNELPFAGHPTLGTAFVLGQTMTGDELRLETGMGVIPFSLQRDQTGKLVSVQMLQPQPSRQAYPAAATVLQALGLQRAVLPIEMYVNGPRHVLVGLPDIPSLSALQPDLRQLASLPDVAINCFAGAARHWRLRMFSPAYGVQEDAATGSAAGPLALHLIRHGWLDWGQDIEIRQGVEMGRAATMQARVDGVAGRIEAIRVGGRAVVVAHGRFIHWQ